MVRTASTDQNGIKSLLQAFPYVAGGGASFLVFSMTLMAVVMSTHGILPRWFAFPAKVLGPLWMAAGIGWAVGYGGRVAEYRNPLFQAFIAAILTIPVITTDPWAITAWEMGPVSALIKVFLFVLPVMTAVSFAYSSAFDPSRDAGTARFWALGKLISLIVMSFMVYLLIYGIILPRLTGVPFRLLLW